MAAVPRAQSPTPTLKKVASLDLPGPGGKRFDYLTIAADDHYLISAHLAAGQTYVIDLRTNAVVATVADTPGVEGVEYVPELKKFYTSNSGDNTIGVVDLKQMKVIKKLPTEAKPDGSAYAAPFHKLYVSDERGKAEAIVDVRTDTIVKTLHFESETGMPQYDPVARKVYVNLQDQNIFAVIDPATDEVVGRYPVGRCKGNHGMTLDPGAPSRVSVVRGQQPDDRLQPRHARADRVPAKWPQDRTSSSSIPARSASTRRARAARSRCFRWTTRTTTASSRTSRSQKRVHSLAVDPATHRVYAPEQEAGRQARRADDRLRRGDVALSEIRSSASVGRCRVSAAGLIAGVAPRFAAQQPTPSRNCASACLPPDIRV